MAQLTEQGASVRDDLAQRYGVSAQAVEQLMAAVLRGGGTQAQFDISELGGMGQWSWGGMTMVGDMFNHGLKSTVSGLCGEIAQAAGNGPLFRKAEPAHGTWQGQGQGVGQGMGQGQSSGLGTGQSQSQGMGRGMGRSMGMGLGMGGGWWPDELGQPASLGSQNDLSYAVFPNKQRLAINLAGQVTVYDTGTHEIGGISQQQSGVGSWIFTSQFGNVDLNRLKVVPPTDREDRNTGIEAAASAQPVFNVAEISPLASGTSASALLQGAAAFADTSGAADTTVRAENPRAQPEMGPEVASDSVSGSGSGSGPVSTSAPSPKGLAQTSDQILSALEKLGSLRDIGILTDAEFSAKKAELLSRL